MILKIARMNITETASAIKTGGIPGEAIKVTFDIYPSSSEETLAIFNLRGQELAAVIVSVDAIAELEKANKSIN